MTAPSRGTREEWRKHAESDQAGVPWMYSGSVLALLDALDAAEERESHWIGQLDAVRVLAERLVMRAEIHETPSEIGVEVLRILGGNS